jgi:SAM-dependent methyltransferase
MNMEHHTRKLWQEGDDELERFALEECVKRQRLEHRTSVLIMPARDGRLAGRFAQLGAQVVSAAEPERRQDVEGRILAAGLKDQVSFATYALPELPEAPNGEPYDIIYLRHGLCHLPYEQARDVVRKVLRKLRIGGKLYVSILGAHSELAEGYPAGDEPINQRFAELDPTIAERYGIDGKVCLYSERNLFMLLLEAGASVLRTFTTTYGNVRGVAVRV